MILTRGAGESVTNWRRRGPRGGPAGASNEELTLLWAEGPANLSSEAVPVDLRDATLQGVQ